MSDELKIAESSAQSGCNDLLALLQAKADNAYISAIGICRREECLGETFKITKGIFTSEDLKWHKEAFRLFGKHQAYSEIIKMIKSEC